MLIGESVAHFRGLQARASLAEVLITQGKFLREQGNISAAYTAVTEALRLALAVGPRLIVAAALEELACTVVAQEPALALRLLAAAAALRMPMGTPVRPVDQAAMDAARATARAALGDTVFAATWSEVSLQPADEILRAIPTLVARRV